MARSNQTSPVARTRIKAFLNERLREVSTATNCARVRWGIVSINTVADTATITTTGLVKVQTVRIPAQNRLLEERKVDQLRLLDPDESERGIPRLFGVQAFNAITCTLRFHPIPNAIYAVTIEGVLKGTDLSADADVAGMPEDYHDILLTGALASEYAHLEKLDLAVIHEQKFEKRIRDLKYFMGKASWLTQVHTVDDWWRV
jgi:hypothetical protein